MRIFHDVHAEQGDSLQWREALAAASAAVAAGEVICLPTDTVYGIGADPFNADAVTALLSAKSRTRAMPPPVLVANAEQASSLVDPAAQGGQLAEAVHALIENFWPGELTIILPAAPTIGWDLGETNGTVALRMPDHPVALALLTAVGPLAVTSANQTGQPPATTAAQAIEQLGEAVSVYLDAGASPVGVPSTIVRLTSAAPRQVELVRLGALTPAEIVRTTGLDVSGGADMNGSRS
ncbi:MAG: L-threonylcarbamoyladenylate synthase [Actinomycetaceae bacterium]|nr:L-threonylcarbamoyladenylate synthase [Actinomycetaceae bacterium]MDY5854544.1 L-threonylcarbamoyladenylate synthase [Arcanobacterium sp.]